MASKKKLLIIDSSALIHRSYHAIPFLKNKKGETVNALYGFCSTIIRFLKELKPSFIVAAFDLPVPTFRHQQFDGYKAKRPKTPEDLSSQIPKVKKFLELIAIPVFEKEGFEADDLIGTISRQARLSNPNLEIVLLSGDQDLLQLVDKNTFVYLLGRGVKNTVSYNLNKIEERYQGLYPEQLVDYKALRGDPSDNIPGVKGIGEKTALELIKKFKNLENLYHSLENDESNLKEKIKEILKEYKKDAFLSRNLVKIKRDLPINFNLKESQWSVSGEEELAKALKELGFRKLAQRISRDFGPCLNEVKNNDEERKEKKVVQESLFSNQET
jgi:DNA polymerase-1